MNKITVSEDVIGIKTDKRGYRLYKDMKKSRRYYKNKEQAKHCVKCKLTEWVNWR